ncbi:C4-dicarboxylate transporter, small subunit [Desulfamplus magnetovallimortis]|uniref:C4-dicarboxylate transporter, small subunit n=1 Tax=Desulfamplus magnetovallimortis TaxID=1246637 RepID=A0A1W1HKK9_9BACT|nr:TRAP transporter small permease subunit [Desulfamplus magnetovallimortis]SLM33009.1 C4-dicarboxylate transporter, small subunit [Desulfamplus magnetovallimortis]
MKALKYYIKIMDAFSEKTGFVISWLSTLLVITVFYDVIMRYVFKNGSIAIQELEWHIFSVIFLLGAAFTLKREGHVRVDILYTKFSTITKAWVDLLGTFIFLIPFCVIVIYSTKLFILASWSVREISPDPGGLPFRYALKAMVPIGFFFLILQGTSEALKNLLVILGKNEVVLHNNDFNEKDVLQNNDFNKKEDGKKS